MNILTNTHRPPTESNIYDKQQKAQKLVTVTDYYNWHTGNNNKEDGMVNSYSIRELEMKML